MNPAAARREQMLAEQSPPAPERKPDWEAHFEWLKRQKAKGGGFIEGLDEERRQLRASEKTV